MGQIVVWEGTIVGQGKKDNFEKWMKQKGFNVKYLTEFKTLKDRKDGRAIPHTGGRNDVLFEVNSQEVEKFAIWRLEYNMYWWEDYLDNGAYKIVPLDILERYKYGWDNNPTKYCRQGY